jgi:hypothetical protein
MLHKFAAAFKAVVASGPTLASLRRWDLMAALVSSRLLARGHVTGSVFTVRLPGGVPNDAAVAPPLAQQRGQKAAEAT